MKIVTNKSKIEELLTRGVEEVIVRESAEKKLLSGKKLRIKHGVDPTTRDLHIGYAVVYEKLRILQEMGHQIIFLIGDFTGRFGDPTDKIETRRLKSKEELEDNVKCFIKQIGLILDIEELEIRRNSEWFDKFSGEDMLQLESNFTVSRMLERDMFQRRIKIGKEIGYHEPVYPMLQAYDSVMLKSDITIVGNDQIFNEIQARHLQSRYGQPPQDIIAMKLLIGLDGKKKMSQSLGNYIGISDFSKEQYGKVMSLPDDLITHYFELATRLSIRDIKEIEKGMRSHKLNPRDAKAQLAREIVSIYYNKKEALKAEKEFNKIFRQKELPSDIPEINLILGQYQPLDLLTKLKLVSSKSEAKRLIEQGGVEIDKRVLEDWRKKIGIKSGVIIKAGKRRFVKIK